MRVSDTDRYEAEPPGEWVPELPLTLGELDQDLRVLMPHLPKILYTLYYKWTLQLYKRAAFAMGADVAKNQNRAVFLDGRVTVVTSFSALFKGTFVDVYTATHSLFSCHNNVDIEDGRQRGRVLWVTWRHMPLQWRTRLTREIVELAPPYYTLDFKDS